MTSLSLSRTVLVLGGARSGKSIHAESLVAESALAPIYIATAEAGDGEMAARIETHRARRGPAWRTIEEPLELLACLKKSAGPKTIVLVDCLTLWLANLLGAARPALQEIERLSAWIGAASGPIVLVSNEVGSGIVPANALAREFTDLHGVMNQRLAASCANVTLMVAGIPLGVKPAKG